MARKIRYQNTSFRPPNGRPAFPSGSLFLIPFGLIFILAGLAPMLATIPWWSWMQTRSWSEVRATITQVGDQLTYEYQFNGNRYMQNSYSSDDDETGSSPAKTEFLAKHQVGETVMAYVNPEDPGEAVLQREIDWGRKSDDIWFAMVFVGIFGLTGLICVVIGFRMGITYIRQLAQFRRTAMA